MVIFTEKRADRGGVHTLDVTLWPSEISFSLSVGLEVLPAYNKQGQEFVKHRAFILQIISKDTV